MKDHQADTILDKKPIKGLAKKIRTNQCERVLLNKHSKTSQNYQAQDLIKLKHAKTNN